MSGNGKDDMPMSPVLLHGVEQDLPIWMQI